MKDDRDAQITALQQRNTELVEENRTLRSPAIQAILEELSKAREKHPEWVEDPIHAAAILAEEAGELVKAAIDFSYSGAPIGEMFVEAAQVGAMAIRFLENTLGYARITVRTEDSGNRA
ncbi:MAG: hypothetical protein HQL37_15315 [Alphaproteobacteria bacterium]|nr:hypothetical protein [Desulfovibrionaceae bacterium]MBF0514544.1 hypothetical protein [Desulfovibrionaceae bacterium]MBF0563339.1 hypothetical protein [Alphaproteobacteria bacterium]